jgi:hypothetical protein
MASILTDLLDESLLNAQIFEDNGYKHYIELNLFEKEIYRYTDNLERNLHGVRKAYLYARVHFWDEYKVRIDCKLKYITPAQQRRYINCGSIKTVKDLFDKELWALTTIEKINKDYENGVYNWPDYEYNVNNIF